MDGLPQVSLINCQDIFEIYSTTHNSDVVRLQSEFTLTPSSPMTTWLTAMPRVLAFNDKYAITSGKLAESIT